jgi:hypothetical protein
MRAEARRMPKQAASKTRVSGMTRPDVAVFSGRDVHYRLFLTHVLNNADGLRHPYSQDVGSDHVLVGAASAGLLRQTCVVQTYHLEPSTGILLFIARHVSPQPSSQKERQVTPVLDCRRITPAG